MLHQTIRKISLTEAGTLFYQGCDKILSDMDIIEQTITAQHVNPKRHLKINACCIVGHLDEQVLLEVR
ncbi:hypothetical protein [Commensalibacter nepenthis]|uniref:LysR family transcriptional regulator n=1 Tax=Commensalibacter nepenthis TaxID=3043872 RepID=A0ABT6Q6L6_9PROT|nr:hypothetical protein [Commensalibacter sp. TBRC 10068]MDI2112532.1 hypothetical protein [Commensalibacter sp. TBRC 10068]